MITVQAFITQTMVFKLIQFIESIFKRKSKSNIPKADVHSCGVPSNKEALVAAYRRLSDAPSRSFIKDPTLFTSGVYIDTLKDIIKNTGPDLQVINCPTIWVMDNAKLATWNLLRISRPRSSSLLKYDCQCTQHYSKSLL